MSKHKDPEDVLFVPSQEVSEIERRVGLWQSPCPVGSRLLEREGFQGRNFQAHLIGCHECRQKYAH